MAEIIIIDNNPRCAPKIDHPKIKILSQPRNIYVNPAWNLGAKISKEEILCLLNDDLEFKPEIIKFTVDLFHNNPEIGLSGLDWPHPFGNLSYKFLEKRLSGFGCMMFIRRKNFFPIPRCLKIYYGDDYIFERIIRTNRRVAAISGFANQRQEHSISTKLIFKTIKDITKRDEILWKRYIRRLLHLRYDPVGFFLNGFKFLRRKLR